jgi:2-polyprenyl-6-methoxyphenol hydroxylase-like FAD-dependent oxidoreductase
MYDAIVVGARCAGSSLAMLLARRGQRVLVVDRSAFPSDTLSTHAIQTPGVARLRRWGLFDAVQATGAPAVRRVHFDQGQGVVLDGHYPLVEGADTLYCVRRTKLDALLVDAAIAAAAEMRQRFTVDELLFSSDGRVTGVRGHDDGGNVVEEQASVVVGADGKHSLVARAVHAPTYAEKPSLSCAYYAYFEDLPSSGFELYSRPWRTVGLCPTNDGLTCVYTAWPRAEFDAYRADIEAGFLATLDLMPGLGERVRSARRVERFYGTADLPNVFRTPAGPGWALVGDAGYVLDPITGQGIGDAFRDAELLADALGAASPEAMASYEKQRNAAAMPMYELTTRLATLAPMPAPQLAVMRALAGNQAQTERFFGVMTGSVSIAEFFSPANLLHLLGPLGLARTMIGMAFAARPSRGSGQRMDQPTLSG